MLTSPDLEFLMEAHNGLAAKIVQNAGQIHNNFSFSHVSCLFQKVLVSCEHTVTSELKIGKPTNDWGRNAVSSYNN